MSASDFNGAMAVAKTTATTAIGVAYGSVAKGIAEIAFGNPLMLSQLAAMGEKKEQGTLSGSDYASLIKIVTDIALGVALAGGATVTMPFLAAWGITGAGLAIYQNRNKIAEFMDDPKLGLPNKLISDVLGTMPDPLVKTIRYVDPLILDLDGDGLEITPLSQGILFDANGDTIKTGTAWAGADDGILVWDRNANGTIDSGKELFGDESILSNGQKAKHGFAALADLDTGHQVGSTMVGTNDGVFNSNDARYADLRIWQDLNQDGTDQANELRTLAQAGITSINLNSTSSNKSYGDAVLVQNGSFTRVDGSTGQAGSFVLAQNNFIRQFPAITITEDARALPDLKASGWVRDLQEAASLDPDLISLLNAAQTAPTRAGYKQAVADLLREWGADAPDHASASKQALSAGYGLIMSEPLDAEEAGWMDIAIKANDEDRGAFRATLGEPELTKFDAMRERMVSGLEKVHAYEAFTGYNFLNWNQIYRDATVPDNLLLRVDGDGDGRRPVEVWVPFSQVIHENRNGVLSSRPGYITVTIPEPPTGMPHVDMLWNRLLQDAATNLMPTLRLSKYLDMVDLDFGSTNISYNFNRLNTELSTASSASPQEGGAVLLDLYQYCGTTLDALGWTGLQQVRSLMQQALTDPQARQAFAIADLSFLDASATGGTGQMVFMGDANANVFNAGSENDLLDGGAGNDTMTGGAGDDTMLGNAGADWISGHDGQDLLQGEAGNDLLFGGYGDDTVLGGDGDDLLWGDESNDWLDGGGGNDSLRGGTGDNLFLFGKGDGQDTIEGYNDNTADKRNVLRFKEGVLPSEIVLRQVRNVSTNRYAIKLSISGTSDQITVDSFFTNFNPSDPYNPVQRFEFFDGTSWDLAEIQRRVFEGTNGADTLIGTSTAQQMFGQAGNDSLTGGAGDDTLDGGDGNDSLYGGAGNNIAYGGEGADNVYGGDGQDTLYGGNHNDTMGGSGGNDLIFGDEGNDYLAGGLGDDTLDGGAGNDTLFGDLGNNLYLFGKGDGQDIINRYSDTAINKLNVLRFKEGVAPSEIALRQVRDPYGTQYGLELSIQGSLDKVFIGGFFSNKNPSDPYNPVQQVEFADGTVWGVADLVQRTFAGTSGADTLIGTIASEMIQGQDGADSITGEGGDDSMVGGEGNDSMYGGAGNDTLEGGNGSDSMWGDAGDNLMYGGDGADQLSGGDSQDTIYGGAQNDTMVGNGGNDLISGNEGNDYLTGGLGDDTLDGGAGNDTLFGDLGNNVYLFGKGDGQDTINRYSDTAINKLNVLRFKEGVAPSEITLRQVRDPYGTQYGLELSIQGSLDKVFIGGFFSNKSPSDPYNPVQQVEFADGTVWGVAELVQRTFAGTSGADTLIGTIASEMIQGQDGADSITGEGGDDSMVGGEGNDSMYGGAGNDTLEGGNGSDSMWGDAGDNLMYGGDGADQLSGGDSQDTIYGGAQNDTMGGNGGNDLISGDEGNDYLAGGLGDDTLDGGAGNDTLFGDLGNNLYLFGKGDGQDIINRYSDTAINKLNVLRFKEGVAPSEIALRQFRNVSTNQYGLELSILGTTDKVMIEGFFANNNPLDPYNPIQRIEFFDNTAWDLAELQRRLFEGSSGADTLIGTVSAEQIFGQDGNDSLTAGVGDDTLDGGAGNDSLHGGLGNDAMAGGAGLDQINGDEGDDLIHGDADNDNLSGGNAHDTLYGDDGNDYLGGDEGNDVLYGGAGNDNLSGGDGNNRYQGGQGTDTLNATSTTSNDVYIWGRGDGADTLNDAGGTDELQILEGVSTDQIWLRRLSNNLEISVIGSGDSMTITNWYTSTAKQVESFKLADGKTLQVSNVQSLVDAMAAFAQPAQGETTLPSSHQELHSVIATNWA